MADEGTTVGVDVDTKAAQKAVNDLTRAFNALLGAMTQLNNASSAFTKMQQQMAGAAGAANSANLNFNNLVAAIGRFNSALGGLNNIAAKLQSVAAGSHGAAINMGSLAQQASNVGSAFTSGFSSAQAAVVSLNQAIGILRTIGSGLVYVTTAFVEMGSAITKTLSQLQGFLSIMTVTAGSSAASQEQLEYIRNTANKFGIEITALTENYAKLRASMEGSANATENSQKLFVAMAMASRSLHSSSQDTKLAFYAVTQMASKGVISMEELRRQLGEKWPGTMEMAARATGRTAASLEAEIRKGSVDSIKFLNAFSDEVIRTYSNSSLVAANSVDAALARLKNLWFDYVNTLLNSGTANEIASMFDAIRDKLADPQLMAYFNAMVSSVVNRIREFITSLTAEDLRNAFNAVKTLIDGVTAAMEKMGNAFSWMINNAPMIAKAATLIAGAYAGAKIGGAAGAALGGVGAIPGALLGAATGAGASLLLNPEIFGSSIGYDTNRGLGKETTSTPKISLQDEIAAKAALQAKEIQSARDSIRKVFESTVQHNLKMDPKDPRIANLFKDYNLSITAFNTIFGELLGRDGKPTKFDAIKDPAKRLKAQQDALIAASTTGYVLGPRPDKPIDLSKSGAKSSAEESEATRVRNIVDRLKQYYNNTGESIAQLQSGFNIKSRATDFENLLTENNEILQRAKIPAIAELINKIRTAAKDYDELNIRIKRSNDFFKTDADRERVLLERESDVVKTLETRIELQRQAGIEQLKFATDLMPEYQRDSVYMGGFEIAQRKLEAMKPIQAALSREYERGALANEDIVKSLTRDLNLTEQLYDKLILLNEARFKFDYGNKYDPFEGMKRGLESYTSMTLSYGEQMKTAMTSAFSSMEDSLTRFITTGKFSLRDLVNTIISEFARVAVRTSVTGPLSSGLSRILSGIGGGGSDDIGATFMRMMGGITATEMHNGGLVGIGGKPRTVDPRLFVGAKRYHTGGDILGPNEVPIIAELGERVQTKRQANQGNSSGVTVVQHINVQGGSSIHDVVRAASAAKQEAINAIIDAQRRGRRRP